MTPSAPFSATEAVTFIDTLCLMAARLILPHFRTPMVIESKGDSGFDPVTQADREAEEAIRQRIRHVYPDHGITGEEFGNENTPAAWTWVIDPIDGTRAFICGLPVWGVLIGVKHHDVAFAGGMCQPFTRERFIGTRQGSVLRTDDREIVLSSSRTTRLEDAILATTAPEIFSAAGREKFFRLRDRVKLCRYGLDCYAYAMVAAGFIDIVVESGLKACDICPLIALVQGAGGVVSDWHGGPAEAGGDVVAAANATLHEKTLRLLHEQ